MKSNIIFSLMILTLTACGSASKDASKVDRDGIRNTVFSNSKSVRECYGQALAKSGNEKMSGKIYVNFDIDTEGKAQKASVVEDRTTLKDPGLQQCVLNQLSQWNFPKPPDGQIVNVIYPFLFADTPARDMQQKMDKFKNIKEKSEKTAE